MTAQTGNLAAEAVDDILTFLGPIPPEEYELRRKIRTCRNAASFKVTQTESRDCRTFCWMVTETATCWIYSYASIDDLTEVVSYLRRLLILAEQAEKVEALS